MDDKNKVLLVEPDRVCVDCGAVKAALFSSYYCPNTDSEGKHEVKEDINRLSPDGYTGKIFVPNFYGPNIGNPVYETNTAKRSTKTT